MNIAIIGAGFSGCNLYNNLIKKNHKITIFDKARGVGGRLSTKYLGEYFLDHGTSSFEAKNEQFKSFCLELEKNHILKLENNRFYPTKGINKVCSFLINKADLKTNQKIKKLELINKKWQITNSQNEIFEGFDKVILTIPAPQILELDLNISEKLKNKLLQVTYNSIFSLIVYGDKKVNNKKLLENNNKLFEKIIDNSLKYNYKDFYSYVFHCKSSFSNENNHLSKEDILKKILDENKDLNLKSFEEDNKIIPHLWKYAKVDNFLDDEYLYEDGLGICGDYFKGNNLEASYLSSLSLLKEL